ncbi:Uncharacterised protein [Salmonella enterica subsp. arizonae]|nr:Uncharacterised protein [Salmonella enterica subsp. arizonae]
MFQLLGQGTVWIILGAIAGGTVFVVSASEYILSVRIILFCCISNYRYNIR